ncbi:putative UPF0704 [Hypsibius exemplaris]|uniref:Cilia- and flagella-associated protein 206 n=1 Tax=Hypsibius exemplaris TaxID=2072580 RepID=A0A9X6N8X0_HYPEX|nr:putative UPF0704 [Hypsibius exemplaris]
MEEQAGKDDEDPHEVSTSNQIPMWIIVDHITRQFVHEGAPVTTDLAEYLACAEMLKNRPFEVSAANLQIYLDNNLPVREGFLANLKREQDAAQSILLDDILTSVVSSTWDVDQLNKKVITYIIRRSGMGDSADPDVLKDCAAAVSSVWPEGTLSKFAYLPMDRKKTELQDYLLLSSGVRLFNKEKQQGGFGIENIPVMLKTNLQKIQSDCEVELVRVKKERVALTDLVSGILQGLLPELIPNEDLLKDALIFLHQYIANIDVLKNEVLESAIVGERALISFHSRIRELQENCRNERVIGANVVFPLFVSLAKDWRVLQGEHERIRFLTNAFTETQKTLKEWEKLKESLRDGFEHFTTKTPEISADPISEERLGTSTIKLLRRDSTAQYDRIPVALKGCCLVTIVEHSGFLASGNKDIGILQYGNYYLSFRTATGAYRFAQDPEKYFREINSCIRQRPVLEKLLGLSVTADGTEELARRSRCGTDRGVQTKTESSSAGVHHLQYFAGLRGGPDAFNKTRFHQIDLSSDKQEF